MSNHELRNSANRPKLIMPLYPKQFRKCLHNNSLKFRQKKSGGETRRLVIVVKETEPLLSRERWTKHVSERDPSLLIHGSENSVYERHSFFLPFQ